MKTNENGRSMVEMLGVLAIMGLLSITGIKGFSLAMNKMTANNIVELVGEISVAAQTQNRCLTLVENDDFASELDDDVTKPKCVVKILAGRTGQVQVVFDEAKTDCKTVATMVADAFGRCRWDRVDNVFVPSRHNVLDGDCADYTVNVTCNK